MSALRLGGVLVAHCVTIESEAILIQMWQQSGGNLARLSIHHADPVGSFHGWRPLMPVTQWHWIKTVEPTS
jgi:precorrin-6Y C5,15-methyltransferase (decarboxylating)